MRTLFVLIAAPILVAACAATGGPEPTDSTEPSPSPAASESLPPLDSGPVPTEMFAAILEDAAGLAGVDASALTVIEAAAVTWSDGSLGCPEPGMMYTQALVPGYRIRVDAAGAPMTYHTRATSVFVLCPPERAGASVDTT